MLRVEIQSYIHSFLPCLFCVFFGGFCFFFLRFFFSRFFCLQDYASGPSCAPQLGSLDLDPAEGDLAEVRDVFFFFFSPNSGYTEGVLTVGVKAGFDQGTLSDPVVSSAQECRFEILC